MLPLAFAACGDDDDDGGNDGTEAPGDTGGGDTTLPLTTVPTT
jgi:hypothetical protein